MTSIQSITTWTCDPFEAFRPLASQEGSALLFSDESVYLAANPLSKVVANSWEELRECTSAFHFGYIGYEMGAQSDPDWTIKTYPSAYPGAIFYQPKELYKFQRNPQFSLYHDALTFLECSETKKSYLEKIAIIKSLIEAGDIYQVNLSQSFKLKTSLDAFSLFEMLYACSPARYAAYLNCGEFVILSFSPELFLSKKRERILSCPIKGTAPRGKTPIEDAHNKASLLSSEKERAELLMITDLMRNDLGRVCSKVTTKELYTCTAYPTIFHLHSTVEGLLKPAHPIDQIRPLFPAGSITGCPKLRAMEVISQLEKRARGIYTGSIGFFDSNGDFSFNVAIRTLTYQKGVVEAQFGGGIVYDSNPENEYEETLYKAGSLLRQLPQWGFCP